MTSDLDRALMRARLDAALAKNAHRGRPSTLQPEHAVVRWKQNSGPSRVPDPEVYFTTLEHLRDELEARVGEWVHYARCASKKQALALIRQVEKRDGENWALDPAPDRRLSQDVPASKGDVIVMVRIKQSRRRAQRPSTDILGPVGGRTIQLYNVPYGGLPKYTIFVRGSEEEFVTMLRNNPGQTFAYVWTPTLPRATRHMRDHLRRAHRDITWESMSIKGRPPMWDKYFQDEAQIAAGELPKYLVHGQITGTYYPPSQEKP